MCLILNMPPNTLRRYSVSYTPDKIPITPKLPRPQLLPQFRKPLEYLTGRYTLQYLHYLRRGVSWRCLDEHMYVVLHNFHRIYSELILLSDPLKHLFQMHRDFVIQCALSVLWYPHQVILRMIYGVSSPSDPHAAAMQEEALARQAPLPRLAASRFPPASLPAGIQRGLL